MTMTTTSEFVKKWTDVGDSLIVGGISAAIISTLLSFTGSDMAWVLSMQAALMVSAGWWLASSAYNNE